MRKDGKEVVIIVLAMIVLVGVFTLLITNTSVRNGIDTYAKKLEKTITVDTLSGEDYGTSSQSIDEINGSAKAIAIGDKAEITSAIVQNRATGTGPWDENDEPGNDSSENNNIVRSFDQVTWTTELTFGLKDGAGVDRITGGTIEFEASLPENCANLMAWDLGAMTWVEDGVLSEDGRTLTGKYVMGEAEQTVPGGQTLVFVLSVGGAPNGTEIEPYFTFSLTGNEPDEKNSITTEKVIVSATGKYNIQLHDNTDYLSNKATVNYGEGDVTGRMYGYGFTVQIYNEDELKGLKGLEYPQGEISFDIDLKLERSMFGSIELEDITDEALPILWNYRVNNWETSDVSGDIEDRDMYYRGIYDGYIPLGKYIDDNSNFKASDYSTYNSGDINIIQDGSVLHVTINNYEINGIFPMYCASWSNDSNRTKCYTDNVGTFSAGYMQIFVPDTVASTVEDRNYYFTVSDSNMNVTSSTQGIVNIQINKSDDSSRIQHVINKNGSYYNDIFILDEAGNTTVESSFGAGDGRINVGNTIEIESRFVVSSTNDYIINTANRFVKFDGDAYEPVYFDNGSKYTTANMVDNAQFKVWYVTKNDGSNWTSQEEMNNGNIEDMDIFESIEDIPEDKICVGMYFETISGSLDRGNNSLYFLLKIKETAEIGKTYGITQRTWLWKEKLDRDEYTITNTDLKYIEDWPKTEFDSGNLQYIKTEYDENGAMVAGTHSGGGSRGNTVLVVGANLHGNIRTVDSTGVEKLNYDLGKNENSVTYSVEPQLEGNENLATQIEDVILKLEVTLPEGLNYVAGSSKREDVAYTEPEITKNDDGSTRLTWLVYGVTSGQIIEPILFDAEIDNNSSNNQQYTTKFVVSEEIEADGVSKIGNSKIDFRTSSTAINIINLSNYRIYKETATPVIESNGEMKYTVTYQNNTDTSVPDFQLLDILPYNGDGRGTSYNGTYTIKNINVTQINGVGEIRVNYLRLYTTTSEEARSLTANDDSIGVSEIWEEKIIGEEINEEVTAIALKGEIDNNSYIELEITLESRDNKGGDTYYNSASATRISTEAEAISTTSVRVEVVNRGISGKVWYDINENGLIDESESFAEGIELELKKADGSKAVDVDGIEVENAMTNSNGKYDFSNLPEGEYIVELKVGENYGLTKANVGNNIEINSKFEETEEGIKQSHIISITGTQGSEISEKNVNAGILAYKDIEVTKVWDHTDNIYQIPEEVKVQVKKTNEEEQEVVVEEKVLNESNKVVDDKNTWTWTFENLPEYDTNGNEINYTIDEVEVNAGDLDYYKTEITEGTETTDNGLQRVIIKNTYNGPVISASKEMRTEMGLSYVVEGEKITYTINVENRGEVGTDVLVKDSIPEGTYFVEGSINVNGTVREDLSEDDLAQGIDVEVPAKESGEIPGEGRISFEVIVQEVVEENGTIRNTGYINKNPEDPESLDEPTNEVKVPMLTYNKTAEIIRTTTEEITEGTVTTGDRVKYTITVNNIGDEAIENIEITDVVPEGTTIYVINDDGEIRLNSTNEITWTIEELGAGDELEVSFEVTVNYSAEERVIRNVGKVDGKETNEVETPYKVPEIGLESSIVKNGTERITSTEEKVNYSINYKAEIREFEGQGLLTIIDYLPYQIDKENSEINEGTYNPEDKTITWVEDLENINTYTNEEGITTIERTKTLTLKYIYQDEEYLSGTIVNNAEGTIRLTQEQEAEDPSNPDETITEKVVVKEETKEDNHEVRVEIPAKVIVHHYIYDEAKGGETTEQVPANAETGDGIKAGKVSDEEINGIIGSNYETTPSDKINANYECVNTEPERHEGTMTKTDIEVTYYYKLKDAELGGTIDKTATASKREEVDGKTVEVLTDEDGVITYNIVYRAGIKEYQGKATITLVDQLPYSLATTVEGNLVDEIYLDGGTYNAIDKTITWTEEVDVDTFTAGQMYDETFEKEIQVVYKDQNVVETLVNEVTGTVTIYYPENHTTNPGEERDTNTVTDTAEVEQEYKVTKEVEKVWDDNDNTKGKRPNSVTVQLTANGNTNYNGQDLEKVVLNNANNWSYTFTNLPKYDGFGNEITYSVVETETNVGDLEYYDAPTIITGELEVGEGEDQATTPNGKITVTNKYKLMDTNLQSSIEKTGTDKITSSKEEVTYSISYNATITDYIGEAVVKVVDTLPYKLAKDENGNLVQEIDLDGGIYDDATQTITWEQTIDHINTYTNRDYEVEISKEITVVYSNLDASQRSMTNHVRGIIDLYETEQTNIVEDTYITEVEIPGNVIVKYVDRETGKEITYTEQAEGEEPVEKTYGYEIEGLAGDRYTTEQKEIPAYTYIENSGNTAGNMIEGTIEVTYYYERTKAGGVHVIYVDEEGNKIAEDENYTGKVGDPYTTEQKDIYGYEFIRVEGEPEGEMTEETIEVVYVYKKLPAKVIVQYLEKDETPDDDSDNRVLYPEETIEGYVGDIYTTERKDIANYKPAEPEPENKTGSMTEEDIHVTYYYEKIPSGKVIAQYVDIDTMDEILYKDEETGEYKTYREESQGYVGDSYTTEKKEIPYYKLVEETIPANKEGKYTEEDVYVTYYYKKLTFNIGVDKNVVEILINGEEQKVLDGKLNKVEVVGSKINSTEIKITYSILVSNTGEIDGTARIKEDIPKNFKLNSETGDQWKETEDGSLEAVVELKAGETKELKIVLNWIQGDYRFGVQKNTVKIVETNNPAGYDETTTDDNESSAEVVMGVKTGSEMSEEAIIITLIGIAMMALVCIYIANKQKKDMIK